MKLKAHWYIEGGGDINVNLSEIDDLTVDGINEWLLDCVHIEIQEQCNYGIVLRPNWTSEDFKEAITEELRERGELNLEPK